MPEPSVDLPQSSWADEIEEGDVSTLPPPSEKIVGDLKIVTQFTFNEEGKKVKLVRTYKVEKKLVSKAEARRKALPKFGTSKGDRPGPNPQTTVVAEEIFMQFVANKEEHEKEGDDKTALDLLKERSKGVVKCRICKEDHWTSNCPYKDTLGPLRESLAGKEVDGSDKAPGEGSGPSGVGSGAGASGQVGSTGGAVSGGKYVPPSKREGGGRMQGVGESMPDRRRTEDTAAIRVSNLSENTQDTDLQELFKPFGPIARIYLSKDKITGQCKGFAFINYVHKEDASKAIATLDGYGYDHLILSVEWAKPSGT